MGPLLIIVPVLRRPHRAAPLMASVEAATPHPHRVLFVGSSGDDDEHNAVRAAGGDLLVIDRPPADGDYQRKVNAAYRASDEPLLFLAADDVHFHPGWFEAAARRLDGRVQVVGTNDLGNPRVLAGEHSTHTLVTRSYVDEHGTIGRPGEVLFEGYAHEYCDDELIGTAKARGVWAFAADSVVEHLHVDYGKAPSDELYAAQRARMRRSRRLFLRRRKMWERLCV